MLPRGSQLSQPFNRSCARLPIARYATTPSIAFSTSPTRCIKRPPIWEERGEPRCEPYAKGSANSGRAERQTFDEENRRAQDRPLIRKYVPRRKETDPKHIRWRDEESGHQTALLTEDPKLQALTAVRVSRRMAREPIENTEDRQARPRTYRNLATRDPKWIKKQRELQDHPAASSDNGREDGLLGGRNIDSQSQPQWVTSLLEHSDTYGSNAKASETNKDPEAGLEEAYPSQGELQAWFKQFTSEQSISKATAQAAPQEFPKMRVKRVFEPDKVESEEEIRKLEVTGFLGPTKEDNRRGPIGPITFREPGEEVGTLTSSINMAEEVSVEQNNEDSGPAIIVLNCVSRSLVESDFRHIAGHGQHVDGWTYGLVKVVQSRSRTTHEPQGCYFLFFDTESNARAYINVLERLHNKSHSRLPNEWQPKNTNMPTPVQPAGDPEISEVVEDNTDELPDVDEWQGDGLRKRGKSLSTTSNPDGGLNAARYTLLPPTTPLHYQIFTRDSILEYENIREAKKGLRPQQILSPPKSELFAVPAPPKDLIDYAQDPQIEHSKNSVLVYLVGSKMTTRALRTAIEIDAEARNYPWQLVQEEEKETVATATTTTTEMTEELLGKDEADPAIKPILSTLSIIKFSKFNEHRIEHELDEFSGGKMGEGEMHGFSRFVVSFADVSEARRFVRTWHKREMLDPRTERMVQVNVTSLW